MEAVKFEKVCFSYTTNERENEDVFSPDPAFALEEIDFSVQQGEFVAVLGHNGSGKSTLARLINGLLAPTAGEISVLGLNAKEESNLFEIRKQVGIVFQNPDNQMVASIVEDDIAFGPENVGIDRKEIGERISFALDAVGMSAYRNSTPSRLSGGQKQRIAIAGVLALKPKIMILDESTAMLDPKGRKEVMDVVLRLNREEKITVILITHFPEEALLADRAVVMSHGRIVMEGTPQEVLQRGDELAKYALTLPRSVRICRGLSARGLPIRDSLFVDTIAEEIVQALTQENASISFEETEEKERFLTTGETGRVYCENLSYTYHAESPFAAHALNGVSLEIKSGEFFGIIGHTGSGKSTFVQHLNGLIKVPTAEKKYKEKKKKRNLEEVKTVLTVDGYDLTDKKTDFNELRSKVGMVFQYPEYQLFAETVFEDVAFGLTNFKKDLPKEEIEKLVRDAIETVGLEYQAVKDRSPFELSGGQKRRIAIAGVIVTRPEILVLDEPAAGLDLLGKEEIMKLLHKIHKEWCKTVIIVSHDMDEIAENCTKAAIFSEGKILGVAEPKDLFKRVKEIQEIGLDVPLTAKIVDSIKKHGIEIDCDYTEKDFIRQTLLYAKGRGTCPVEGGERHA